MAGSDASLSTGFNATRTRRMSTTKIVDNRPKHLMLGDFELANVVWVEKNKFERNTLFNYSDCEEYVLCCKYSPLGDVFAVGLGNGTIKVSLYMIAFFVSYYRQTKP